MTILTILTLIYPQILKNLNFDTFLLHISEKYIIFDPDILKLDARLNSQDNTLNTCWLN